VDGAAPAVEAIAAPDVLPADRSGPAADPAWFAGVSELATEPVRESTAEAPARDCIVPGPLDGAAMALEVAGINEIDTDGVARRWAATDRPCCEPDVAVWSAGVRPDRGVLVAALWRGPTPAACGCACAVLGAMALEVAGISEIRTDSVAVARCSPVAPGASALEVAGISEMVTQSPGEVDPRPAAPAGVAPPTTNATSTDNTGSVRASNRLAFRAARGVGPARITSPSITCGRARLDLSR
jgi:hypothetical protein